MTQLTRQNKLLDGELGTVRVQLEARTKALEDVQGQLDQALRRLAGGGDEDRKQEKIEILTAQVGVMVYQRKLLLLTTLKHIYILR